MKRSTPKTSFFALAPWAAAGCALLTLFTLSAQAVDRAVPSAFLTIQAAVNAAQPGDRILVAPGVYQENVVSTNSNLQFIGKNTVWDGTLVNGAAGVCLTATGDNLVVQGFIFRAGLAGTAQVQLTGTNCRVLKCTSRSATARFLRITGNSPLVDSCSLFALDNLAVELIGDNAVVNRLRVRQCDDNVIRITGNEAKVTGCTMALNEDGASIAITGSRATVSQNTFVNCDSLLSITGTNNTVTKNKSVNSGSFISLSGANPVVDGNRATLCSGAFIAVSSSANALIQNNQAAYCSGTFISFGAGSNAVVLNNKLSLGTSTFLSINSDNARVEKNLGKICGPITVTGDGVTVRGNTISDAFNDRSGLTVNSRTSVGGGVVEKNTIKEVSQFGLVLGCNNVAVLGNKVTAAGTELSNNEGTCRITGTGNRLTNNVVISSGAHGFDILGSSNTLVKCSAIDAASDGFHIVGNGNTLLICDAMLCTGEGLDNGGADTTVLDCAFKNNRIDVANDGTITNLGTFAADNTFTTGGPAQLPQVD